VLPPAGRAEDQRVAAWSSLVCLAAACGGNDGGTGPGGGLPLQGRYLLVGANDVWVYYDFCTADAGEDLDLAFAH
jgi:hypothetical protein